MGLHYKGDDGMIDYKIEISYSLGQYMWKVLTSDGVLLVSGSCTYRKQAAKAAIAWIERPTQ